MHQQPTYTHAHVFSSYRTLSSLSSKIQGRSQGRVAGVPEPLGPPRAKELPPLLFLTVILSQQEYNGLSIPDSC